MRAFETAANYFHDPMWLLVLLCLFWVGVTTAEAIYRVRAVVRDVRHRREVRHRGALHEHHGITYRIGSPPSHAAGSAR